MNGAKAAARALDAVLEAERSALLVADFNALKPILAKKDALFRRITATEMVLESPILTRLKGKAQANEQLLTATLHGLRKAIETLPGGCTTFNTYDRSGMRHALTQIVRDLEHRA